jgi:hypothetical protein
MASWSVYNGTVPYKFQFSDIKGALKNSPNEAFTMFRVESA